MKFKGESTFKKFPNLLSVKGLTQKKKKKGLTLFFFFFFFTEVNFPRLQTKWSYGSKLQIPTLLSYNH